MQRFEIIHVFAGALVLGGLVALNQYGDRGMLPWSLGGALAGLVGAAISSLICRWWPGLAAPGWKLWLVMWLANPVIIYAVVDEILRCTLLKGPGLFAGMFCGAFWTLLTFAVVAAACVIAPTIAIVARWLSPKAV